MGLFDIFKIDELKTRIAKLEQQLRVSTEMNKELQRTIQLQKNEYEQKIKNQEEKHKKIISRYEQVILAFEEAANHSSSGEVTIDSNGSIDVFSVDNPQNIDEMFELNNRRQMSQIEALSNPATNNLKVKKTSKGVIIEKYIGDEEVVVIPPVIDREVVYKIGDTAFYNCHKTKKVELPNTVSEIGKEAFSESGLEQINLPDHLVLIDEWAFSGTALSELVLPPSLQSIGKYAFSGTDIKELIVPENIKVIPEGTFANTNLKTLIIKGATSIGKQAFYGALLKKIVLPDSLKNIEAEAFGCGFRDEKNYLHWTRIIIPRSVEKIGIDNFEEGQHVALLNENVEIAYGGAYGYNSNIDAIFYCNNGGIAFERARKFDVTVKPLAEFPDEIIEDSDDEWEDESDDFDEDDNEREFDKESDEEDKDEGGNGTNENYCGDGELDTSSWNLESILRQEGYTVSQKEGLSDYERQQILLSVMRRNLMSKWQIIEHIELQISLRRNNKMYSMAISKWERDLSFLRKI